MPAGAPPGERSFIDTPMEDKLLVCTAKGEGHVHVSAWWMIIASGTSGAVESTQTFMKLKPPDGFDMDSLGEVGAEMQIERCVYHPPSSVQSRPFDEQACAPCFFTEREAAAAIANRERFVPSEIVVERVLFRDSPEGVVVTGKDTAFERMLAVGAAAPKAKAKAKPKAAMPAGHVDFMDLLSQAAHRPNVLAIEDQPDDPSAFRRMLGEAAVPELAEDSDLAGWAHALLGGGDAFDEVMRDVDLLTEAADRAAEAEERKADTAARDEADVSGDELERPGEPGGGIYAAMSGEAHAALVPELVPVPEPAGASSSGDALVPAGEPAGKKAFQPALPEFVQYERTGAEKGLVASVKQNRMNGTTNRIGVVHVVRVGSIKATCSVHKRCGCWLTLRGRSHDEGEQDAASWLAAAAERGEAVDEDEHWRRSQALKRPYGMLR